MVDLLTPSNRIWLQDCDSPDNILKYCREHGIKRYAYSFAHRNDPPNHLWKIGRSDARMIGERIYRQSQELPGWGKRFQSSNGSDFAEIINDYYQLHPSQNGKLHKNDVYISIWNVTHLANHTQDPKANSIRAEIELYDQYIDNFKTVPFNSAPRNII
jgi:hypothetical protein